MELRIAGAGEWRPLALGASAGVHSDILAGRDCEIGWEDVFVGKSRLGSLAMILGRGEWDGRYMNMEYDPTGRDDCRLSFSYFGRAWKLHL